MALWWIGNAVFLLVVIPVVIVLLQPASLGQQPGQRREHRAICPRQAQPPDLTT